MAKKFKGRTVDSFLDEEGLLDNAEAVAIKRVIAYELQKAMRQEHITKSEMAEKMHTSRSALDRLLDPNNTSITLNSIVKAAHFLGKELRFSLA